MASSRRLQKVRDGAVQIRFKKYVFQELADIKKAAVTTYRIFDSENMLQWTGILIPVSGFCAARSIVFNRRKRRTTKARSSSP
jgi:hypothetical protein